MFELQEKSHNHWVKLEGSESVLSLENGTYDASHDYHVDMSGDNTGCGSPGGCYDDLGGHGHAIQCEMQEEDEEEKEAHYDAHIDIISRAVKANRNGHVHSHSSMQAMVNCPFPGEHIMTHDTKTVSCPKQTSQFPLYDNSDPSSLQQASHYQQLPSRSYMQETPCNSEQKPTLVHDNHMENPQAINRVVKGAESPYTSMINQPVNPYISLAYSDQCSSWNLGSQDRGSCRPMCVQPQEISYHQNMLYCNNIHNMDVAYRPTHPIQLHRYPNQKFGNESHMSDYEPGLTSKECHQPKALE